MKCSNFCLVKISLKTVCSVVMCECTSLPPREPSTNPWPLVCVFMLVQLNKCVIVCGSDLQRGHSGDGCLSSSILFKYENSRGHFWFLHLIRSLFNYTYNLRLNSMFWKNLRSVLVLYSFWIRILWFTVSWATDRYIQAALVVMSLY